MEERYYVQIDYQGGEFGMGRNYTIKQWKCQAMCWASTDENYAIVKQIYKLKDEDVLQYIGFMWELKFRKCGKTKRISFSDIEDYNDFSLEHYYKEYMGEEI